MKITINTNEDLLKFVENDKVTIAEAVEVTNKFLNVYCSNEVKSKEELIIQVREFIEKYCYTNAERPFFMGIK